MLFWFTVIPAQSDAYSSEDAHGEQQSHVLQALGVLRKPNRHDLLERVVDSQHTKQRNHNPKLHRGVHEGKLIFANSP